MPTQVYILSFAVNTYTLYVALGAVAGIALTLWQVRGSVDDLSRTLTGLLIIAVSALLGGRVGYVLLNAGYFAEHAAEMASTASPGFWEQTAIVGGICGWFVASRIRRPVATVSLTTIATLCGVGASLGCIPAGCAYGREVYWTDGWVWYLRADLPDAYTLNNPRLPTQLFMVGWLVLSMLVIVLLVIRRNRRDLAVVAHRFEAIRMTSIVAWWVLLFGIGDFIIQFLRADSQPTFANFRISQVADAALVIAGMLWLIVVKIRCPQNNGSYV